MKKIITFLVAISVVGCATSPQVSMPPIDVQKVPIYTSNRLPSKHETQSQNLIEGTYFGAGSSKKGSVLLGLLLGPLGVAINVNNIQNAAKKTQGIEGVAGIDIGEVINSNGVSSGNVSEGSTDHRIEIVPAVSIFLVDEESFQLSCVMNVDLISGSISKWKSRYTYNMENIYSRTSENVVDVESVKRDISECFLKTKAIYNKHVAGNYENKMALAEIKTTDGYTLAMPAIKDPDTGDLISKDIYGFIRLRESGIKSFKFRE